jgi:hypothetical protein
MGPHISNASPGCIFICIRRAGTVPWQVAFLVSWSIPRHNLRDLPLPHLATHPHLPHACVPLLPAAEHKIHPHNGIRPAAHGVTFTACGASIGSMGTHTPYCRFRGCY